MKLIGKFPAGTRVRIPPAPLGLNKVNKYNPIAHLADGIDGAFLGIDRHGNSVTPLQTVTNLASGITFLYSGFAEEGGSVLTGISSTQQSSSLVIRSDVSLSGGRSGQLVKNLTAPSNSVVKGGAGRIFITNGEGKVIWDVTTQRVKSVIPGEGFGGKAQPSLEMLNYINQIWGK